MDYCLNRKISKAGKRKDDNKKTTPRELLRGVVVSDSLAKTTRNVALKV